MIETSVYDLISREYLYPNQNPKRMVIIELPCMYVEAEAGELSKALGFPENVRIVHRSTRADIEYLNRYFGLERTLPTPGFFFANIAGDLPKEFEVPEGELIPLCEMVYDTNDAMTWPKFLGFKRVTGVQRPSEAVI